jgi:glycosyltransferase involved in cell wall biosynthesis
MLPWKNRAIDHVISVSRAVADGNGVANRPNSSVIPNFIPDAAVVTSDASGMPGSTVGSGLPVQPFLFFAGDLCREKGVHSLLRAYESLGRQRPPLLLVGRQRPDTPTELPERAEIRFDWPHEHVMAAFRQCLMAVLPSVWPDPCPTTVLEAMASGRPVITTSSGGIVDLVVDGESGLLVAPDNERGLAAAMARVLSNDALRLRLASGASERALLFTSSAVVKRVENVYAEVAGRCQGV